MPQLVVAEDLPSANALTSLGWQTSQLLGPIIGASCIALAGSAIAFAFDGLTFVISIGTLLVVRLPMQSLAKDEAQKEDFTPLMNVRRVITDVRDGMRFIVRSPFLFVTLLVAVVANIGSGAIDVALPKLVRDFYHASSWLLGLLSTMFFLGVLLATWFVGQMGRIHRRAFVGYLCLFPTGLGSIVLGMPWSRGLAPVVSCVVYAIMGLCGGIFGLFYTTLTQEAVPNDMMGRVASIQVLSLYCMMPMGLVLGGIVAENIGPNWVFISSGLLSLVVVCCALGVPAIRKMD